MFSKTRKKKQCYRKLNNYVIKNGNCDLLSNIVRSKSINNQCETTINDRLHI